MEHFVQCRICKNKLDTQQEPYVLIGKKSYYHKECYDSWVKNKININTKQNEDFWKESLIDYLYRDVKMTINFAKFNSQWNSFIKPNKKMTPKGIFFAIKYFFEIQKADKEKAKGGIGIVPMIYKESAEYWINLEQKKVGTMEGIIEQMRQRVAREVKIVQKKEKNKNKNRFNLDDI